MLSPYLRPADSFAHRMLQGIFQDAEVRGCRTKEGGVNHGRVNATFIYSNTLVLLISDTSICRYAYAHSYAATRMYSTYVYRAYKAQTYCPPVADCQRLSTVPNSH